MDVAVAPQPGFLSRERTIAAASFNRWLVPPAALAIHLCIGMAYGFSVFWLPLSRVVGGASPKECPADMGFFSTIVATDCDWKISMLGWTFTLFFVLLGSSAAIFGHWLETAGPRKAGLAAAFCWCGGLLISALGVYLHQIWMLWLGSGVIGGVGLGLGYISPVSTLIKWFPDRRGLATGLAIMGFGGGAMIGAPLADKLMGFFATPTSPGVWQTFVALAAIYFVFMVSGALGYRVPPDGWAPKGWTPPAPAANALVTHRHVHLDVAWKTPQFWLLWGVLCLNVSAGIGVLGMASPMLQEVFGGKLIGVDIGFDTLDRRPEEADRRHRGGLHRPPEPVQHRRAHRLGLGLRHIRPQGNLRHLLRARPAALRGRALRRARAAIVFLFVLLFAVIITMYGGGFATIPAYLADIFGTHYVGAIHGRLLTAWSTAGVLGPVLVNYIREYQLSIGVPREAAYNQTMYVLAGLLLVGLICNLLVRPVDEKYYMTDEEVAATKKTSVAAVREEEKEPHADFEDYRRGCAGAGDGAGRGDAHARQWRASRLSCCSPGRRSAFPLAWGVSMTVIKALALFH